LAYFAAAEIAEPGHVSPKGKRDLFPVGLTRKAAYYILSKLEKLRRGGVLCPCCFREEPVGARLRGRWRKVAPELRQPANFS